ncbi:hypothetical protein EZV62_001840 [Acer yangbiense]|uniref:DNA helicase Pif1-like 2B domain-containing protein n=1 Tax=Acer yangbiense TaxID=1000413 RepID=A0A5C7IVF8_9ROSI|nr:hypothetical protein EZV62_001840 [Acer yangbiense]
MLINFQKGCTQYEDIRTINWVEYPSFKDACYCLGLLDDDKKYIDGIKEASFWGSAHYIRRVFANLLLSNSMTRPKFVWESCWKLLSDDNLHHQKRVTGRQGDERTYLSLDNIYKEDANFENEENTFSPNILNTFTASRLSNHKLNFKVRVPVMLLRNIDQSNDLCNGTRLLITKLGNHVIEAKILSGNNIGQIVLIPRMTMTPSSHTLPVKFKRRQFPLVRCFAMTINKSQWQNLSHVGIHLPRPVFSHGQLYVALSRVKSKQGLKILIIDDVERSDRRLSPSVAQSRSSSLAVATLAIEIADSRRPSPKRDRCPSMLLALTVGAAHPPSTDPPTRFCFQLQNPGCVVLVNGNCVLDILRSSKIDDLKKKERELQVKEAELKRRDQMENMNYEDFLLKPKDKWITKSTTNVYCNLNGLPDIVKVLRKVGELAAFRRTYMGNGSFRIVD